MPDSRLVNKDVMLGVLRELEPPQEHIGLSLLPMQDVASDDVIWDAVKGLTAGLAPARAMDAESETQVRDEVVGTGKASIVDWSVKDRWNASDVARYREVTSLAGTTAIPRTVASITDDWNAKMNRAMLKRKRQLDNRVEWLIWGALRDSITYDDGKIKFSTTYGIPADQKDQVPSNLWSDNTNSDPIGNLLTWRETVRNRTGVELSKVVTSRKVLFTVMNNTRFAQMFTGQNPFYWLNNKYGIQEATEKIGMATDMQFTVYDANYRTRPFGSTTITNTRFNDDRYVYLFPDPGALVAYSGGNNGLGLGNILSSPHPEGNWQSGFYEWEKETTDPWGYDQGTGIKAYPIVYAPEVLFNARVLA